MTFYAYALLYAAGHAYETQDEVLADLVAMGFRISEPCRVVTSIAGAQASYEEVAAVRDTLPFEIDSMVYKLARFRQQGTQGWRTRTPRWTVDRVAVAHALTSGTACLDQRLYRIAHYASRLTMDIEGLGESAVQKLLDARLIGKVSNLYKLTVGDRKALNGGGATSTTNLVT